MICRRSLPGLAGAALCAGLLLLVHRHADVGQWLAGHGSVAAQNAEMGLSAQRAAAVLRHLEMLLLGGIGLSLVAAATAFAGVLPGSTRRQRLVRFTPFFVVTAIAVTLAIHFIMSRSVLIGSQRHFYLFDDAMSSMRYARNLVEGNGLVYNPGERVEGYTNFLWVMVMAAIHWLGAGLAHAPLWVLVLGWACAAATGLLAVDLLRTLGLDPFWCACVGMLVVCDENMMAWASSGLETTALTAAVTACAWALARDKAVVFSFALATIPLLRADGFLLAGALAVAAGLRPHRTWSLVRVVLPAILLLVAQLVFRRLYYGQWLPNTYYLRMLDLADRVKLGLATYGLRLAVGYPVVALLGAYTALAKRTPPFVRLLAAAALAQAAYAIWLGGDIFTRLRFVTPVLPLMYVCAALALAAMAADSARRSRLLQALLLGTSSTLAAVEPSDMTIDGPNIFLGNVGLAHLVEKNLPAATTVTIYAAGTVPYYANQARYIDIFGKNDQHLAHLPRYEGLALGHNKLDFDYVYDRRRPDVAFVLTPCVNIRNYLEADPTKQAEILAFLPQDETPARYRDMSHPTFIRDYFPNQVHYFGFPSPTPLECLFVRRGSNIPLFWSPTGAPPRPRELTLDCDFLDGAKAAAFGPGWGPVEFVDGRSVRRIQPGKVATIDVWIAIDAPATVDVCAAAPSARLDVAINGHRLLLAAARHASCAGQLLRGSASTRTLASDVGATHVAILGPHELLLDSIQVTTIPPEGEP